MTSKCLPKIESQFYLKYSNETDLKSEKLFFNENREILEIFQYFFSKLTFLLNLTFD